MAIKNLQKAYVAKGGLLCPHCNSYHIVSDPLQADGLVAWAGVNCYTCGATWSDEYALIGYYDLDLVKASPNVSPLKVFKQD